MVTNQQDDGRGGGICEDTIDGGKCPGIDILQLITVGRNVCGRGMAGDIEKIEWGEVLLFLTIFIKDEWGMRAQDVREDNLWTGDGGDFGESLE